MLITEAKEKISTLTNIMMRNNLNSSLKQRFIFKSLFIAGLLMFITSCKNSKEKEVANVVSDTEVSIDLNKQINDCEKQLEISVPKLTDLTKHPRLIETNETEWKEVTNNKLIWTSGFYPGILWYAYDVTGNDRWKQEAIKRTEVFGDYKNITEHHDIGFMMFPAYGLGYEIGGKKEYKDILLASAQSLSTRFKISF